MNRQLRQIIGFSALLLGATGLAAQSVWPGDINNNGIVNGVDFLFWGEAFGSVGPARTVEETDWAAQDPPANWGQSFPNGLNYYFADANGDGIVDDNDDDSVIEDNFGLTHGIVNPDSYNNALPGTAPALQLIPANNVVGVGEPITIALSFGTAELPVQDFKGLALKLSIETTGGSVIDEFDFDLEEDNWLDPTGNFVRDYFIEDDNTSDLAITRINQQAVSGSGEIGHFSVVIEDIIVGLNMDTVTINIDSVYFLGSDLLALPIVPANARVVIAKDPLAVVDATAEPALRPIQLFPNPARDQVLVRRAEGIQNWQLFNAAGQSYPLLARPSGNQAFWLQWPSGLPPGVYYIRGQGDGIMARQTLVILPSH